MTVLHVTRRAALASAAALAAGAAAPATTAWDFAMPSIDDGTLSFADYRGRVLLVANTASFCGYTYQYKGLEQLHADLTPKGLTVIGIPSQDFEQESGDNKTVKQFCEATFGVKFPMAGLSHVRGPDAAPFYAWVREQQNGWQPRWNFNKVLIGRDGRIIGTFASTDEPGGAKLTQAIEAALAAKPAA